MFRLEEVTAIKFHLFQRLLSKKIKVQIMSRSSSINVATYKHKLNASKSANETIDNYLLKIKKQANICSFEDNSVDSILNLLIRDQFISGLGNPKIVEALLSAGSQNLQQTVDKAKVIVQAVDDAEALTKSSCNQSILTISKNNKYDDKNKCYTCGKFGHFQKNCR